MQIGTEGGAKEAVLPNSRLLTWSKEVIPVEVFPSFPCNARSGCMWWITFVMGISYTDYVLGGRVSVEV